jgi:plastocyanin
MADTQQIDIRHKKGEKLATFTPVKVTAGSLVFWTNHTSDKHWPAPQGGPDDGWFNAEIPGKLPGQAPPVSSQVAFGEAGKVSYYCALHPDEIGTIEVV